MHKFYSGLWTCPIACLHHFKIRINFLIFGPATYFIYYSIESVLVLRKNTSEAVGEFTIR